MLTPVTVSSTTANTEDADEQPETELDNTIPTERFTDWKSVTMALREQLTTTALDKTIRYFIIIIINLSVSVGTFNKFVGRHLWQKDPK